MSQHLIESSTERFQADVLDASVAMPVLVDFWAEWCQPCRMLAPILERVAEDYAGRARVVKVNTDAEQQLAASHGIRSLPTVRLFRRGRAVEEIVGVQPESVIRAMIERHLEKPSDRERAEAARLVSLGRADEAVLLLDKVVREEPDNHDARIELIEALAIAGQTAEAEAQFETLPVQAMDAPRLRSAQARLHFAKALAGAPGMDELAASVQARPDDLERVHQLAARELLSGRAEPALEKLIGIMQRDRGFGDGVARRSLLAAFDLLADREDLVHGYRRRMMALLH